MTVVCIIPTVVDEMGFKPAAGVAKVKIVATFLMIGSILSRAR